MARRPKEPLVLAIDIGSTSVRARVYDAVARPVKCADASVDHPIPFLPDGGAEDDAESLRADVESVIDDALDGLEKDQEVAGVGLSTYVGNVLGVDATGRPATPIYTYADGRSAPDVARLRKVIGDRVHHNRTGAPVHTAYQAPRLAWVRRTRPTLFRAVRQWVDVGTYLYSGWFGETNVPASYSVASWSGMLDRGTLEWDVPTLNAAGIDTSVLPPLADYTASLSGLRRRYARRWPALAGARFFLAVGDGAAANVGVGGVGAGACALTAGTTGAMRAVVPGAPATVPAGLWAYRLDARHSVVGGAITDAGSLFHWLTTRLRLPPPRRLDRLLAAMPPAAHGVSVLPFLRGERSPGWATEATAAFAGVRDATTPVDLVRASLEAISYRFALIWELLRKVAPASEIVAGGRALRSSPAWMQMLADVLQMPIVGATEKSTSARGVAVIVLTALGALPGYDALPARRLERYDPVPESAAAYRRARRTHGRLYELLAAGTGRM